MALCSCDLTLGNTGKPGCVPLAKVMSGIYLMFTTANDGTKNKIPAADFGILDDTYFNDLINHVNPTKRIYPIQNLQNIEGERADTIFKEYNSGFKVTIRQGVRNVLATIPQVTPALLEKLEKFNCEQVSMFIVDNEGNLTGKKVGGDFYPIEIQKGSWDPKLIMATEESPSEILLQFNWGLFEKDADLVTIFAGSIDANLLSKIGLIDVYGDVTNITTTGFDIRLYTDYGDFANPITVKGLLDANFTDGQPVPTASAIYNNSTASTIAITSTEVNGTYSLNYATQSSGNVLSLLPVLTGYDFTAVGNLLITIP